MRALQVTTLDGPDGLELVDLPEPEAAGNLLIDVHAAGAAFPDLLLSRGEYQLKPPPPFVPGVEVAGTVREAPDGSDFAPGDRVFAFAGLGGFAEVAVAVPGLAWALPESVSFATGAALVSNHNTAHFALRRRGRLREGETVLVAGAGGGLGTATIELARAFGARVLAVAGDEARREAALRAGAEAAFDGAGDWLAEVREHTAGRGADVVVDPVGGDGFADRVRALAPEGRLLVLGFAAGSIPEIAVNRLLLRNVDIVGVNWGGMAVPDPGAFSAAGAEIAALAEEGRLDPVIGARYPLADGAQALRDLEARRAVGKLVLEVR